MSIRNKGNHNINVEGNDNIVKVTNCYGIDETSNIVFNFDLLNEVLDILKKNITISSSHSVGTIPLRDIKKKNKKNKMSTDYFEKILCNDYLPFFQQIEDYFKNVNNKDRLDDYSDICKTINMQYFAERSEYPRFEEFIALCYRTYFYSGSYKQEVNTYCKILLHFMYWHCDIGENV